MEASEEITESRQLLNQIRSLPQFKPLKSKQRRFIIAYAGCGKISSAANMVHVSWIAHYHWLERDPNYRQAFEKAKEMFSDYAEGEVFERAFFGEERNIWNKGKLVETVKQKSDILAMFALKGLKPQYRDSFNPQGAAAPINLAITYPTQVIDITPQPVVKIDDK